MADVTASQNQHAVRFKQFLARSITVACRRIEAEGHDVPISDEARERAHNVLGYALESDEVWVATCELLLTMAPKMEMAGYRSEWLPYLHRGLGLSEVHQDGWAGAKFRLHMGHLHRLQSQFETAHTLLTASATAFAQVGDQRGQARALNQLAYLAWQQHQAVAAEQLAQQALALLTESALERAMSLSALGLAAIEQHRWLEAEAYHRAALEIRTAHGDRRQMAWSQQNLGYALRGQQKYGEAIAYYQQAIATLTVLADAANCAIAQMNLGIVYWLQGEASAALAIYQVAETTFRRLSDELYLAKVLVNQGLAYLSLRDWPRAEQAFTNSTMLFQRLADLSEYLNALDGLGISYLEQGCFAKALAIFESIIVQLPNIEGTHQHQVVAKVIYKQLEQAKAGQSRGVSSV